MEMLDDFPFTAPLPRRVQCVDRCGHFVRGYCTGSGLALEPEAITWRKDYGRAIEEARVANRLLWIQFTSSWCPNCTRMERESFPHPAIVQHARDSFVPVMLRADVHEQLALGFNLSGLPATVIVSSSREILASHQGFLGPAEFEAFLRESLSRQGDKSGSLQPTTDTIAPKRSEIKETSQQRGNEPLALAGYCPVSLVRDRKLVVGKSEYTLRHAGWIYRFASLESSDRFRQEPDGYVPARNGMCAVNQMDHGMAREGNPQWGVLYGNHLFLCASEQDRRRFLQDPERYAMVDVAEQGFCATLHSRIGFTRSRRSGP